MTRVVKEGYIYHQTYRGSTSRGLKSPFLFVPLTGAHRFLPIIAQDFSPGRPCAPAANRQRKMNIAQVSGLKPWVMTKPVRRAPQGHIGQQIGRASCRERV